MPDARSNWINGHFIYTHGYGMVMAEANRITANGQPVLIVRGAAVELGGDVTEGLGQQVVVENLPGAGGIRAAGDLDLPEAVSEDAAASMLRTSSAKAVVSGSRSRS